MSTERVFAWIIKASLQNLFYYAIVTHLDGHIRIYTYLGGINKLREQDFDLFLHPLPPCGPVY